MAPPTAAPIVAPSRPQMLPMAAPTVAPVCDHRLRAAATATAPAPSGPGSIANDPTADEAMASATGLAAPPASMAWKVSRDAK
jgi:hypothetical protein